MAITLQQRKRRLAATSAAGLGLIGLILVLVNLLGNYGFLRCDLTQTRAYSLSKASQRLVRDLKDPVIVKAYFTPDLPSPYNAFERYVRDMLAEYRAASHGQLRYEFVMATPSADFERKAAEAGMMPIQFEEVGSDQLQIRRGYMGLTLFHRDRSETLPIVKDVQQLEYDLTSRIAKMAVRQKKVIAVTSGHGELAFVGRQSKLGADLPDLYEFKETPLPLASTASINADALLIVGPKQRLDDRSLWSIDQAIMRGIPTAFLVDIKNLMVNQFFATSQETGLEELLKHYGVRLGDRLVYDAQCETIGVTQNMAGFAFTTSLRYPYIPTVTRFEPDHSLVRGLDSVGLPFVTTVEAASPQPSPVGRGRGEAAGEAVHFTPILSTSNKSWLAPDQRYMSVAPTSIPSPKPDEPHGPYSVGALLEGTLTSYYSATGPWRTRQSLSGGQGANLPVTGQSLIGTSPKTQIFVLGTARLLDPGLPQFPGEEALFSNVLAYLSKDETLIGIRSKGEILRPLKPVSTAVKEFVKYGTVLGVAMLPVALGLWRWRRREQWRRAIAMAFAPRGTA
jgi:gliding-associated putative ABC transporter substrate-binding component GldG